MGLDMYLTKRTYVKRWNHTKDEFQFDVRVSRGGKPYKGISPSKISYIIEEVMYWRKANQIHTWFVENVQGGTDECQESYVDREQLDQLIEDIDTVLASLDMIDGKIYMGSSVSAKGVVENYKDGKIVEDSSVAEELLPTSCGFFFGGTEYDEYYVSDLTDTRDKLLEALKDDDGEGSFYYQASW